MLTDNGGTRDVVVCFRRTPSICPFTLLQLELLLEAHCEITDLASEYV
jgi:hypothetical protein